MRKKRAKSKSTHKHKRKSYRLFLQTFLTSSLNNKSKEEIPQLLYLISTVIYMMQYEPK
jgi:hypothetical protein